MSYVRSKRLVRFGHVCGTNGQLTKEILVNKTNRKRPLGRPGTRWAYVSSPRRRKYKRKRDCWRTETERFRDGSDESISMDRPAEEPFLYALHSVVGKCTWKKIRPFDYSNFPYKTILFRRVYQRPGENI